jgi:hypothetical protein
MVSGIKAVEVGVAGSVESAGTLALEHATPTPMTRANTIPDSHHSRTDMSGITAATQTNASKGDAGAVNVMFLAPRHAGNAFAIAARRCTSC